MRVVRSKINISDRSVIMCGATAFDIFVVKKVSQ